MSIVILTIFFALTLAQLVFYDSLIEIFGSAASISVLGLCAALTLILMSYVAATHTFGAGRADREIS